MKAGNGEEARHSRPEPTVSQERGRSESSAHSVRLAILSKRFDGITSKMHNTLLRTARSGVINNGRDFSCCILTADAELLAVGESIPMHVMIGADIMARSMMEFHPELKRGDAFLHNSPYHGCTHAADLSVLVPVIDDEGVHRFTVLSKAHQADIGNAIPTTYMATARDVYEEGALIFPAVKVQHEYRDIDDIIRMCMLRIRAPEQWRGDHLASLGAARIGERELLALGAEVGWSVLEDHIGEWFDYSEARMLAAIGKLPSGRGTAHAIHDPFPGTPPEGIRIEATVDVDSGGGRIEVDLRNNPDCMPCGLNSSEATARSGAMIGVFNSLDDPNIPTNAGSFRRIEIHLRENCIAGVPRHPTSCSVATSNVADRLINVVQMAIASLGEGFGMAEFGGGWTASQAVVSGFDPRSGGTPFVNEVIMGDTLGGASPSEDGWLTCFIAGSAGLGFYDSVEVNEIAYPIRVFQRRLVPDTEGAGRFRGAPASHVEFGPVGCSLRVVTQSDGAVNPAQGVRGGGAGAPARNYKRCRSGELVEVGDRGWIDFVLDEGEKVIGISCGGGGYGSPLDRDSMRVKEDVDEGYIARARAEEVYGAVFDKSGAIDEEATNALRKLRMRSQ